MLARACAHTNKQRGRERITNHQYLIMQIFMLTHWERERITNHQYLIIQIFVTVPTRFWHNLFLFVLLLA